MSEMSARRDGCGSIRISRLSLKELTMSLMLFFNEPCPKCYMPIMQGVVDAHPSRNDVAIQNSTAQTAAL
jgi:hypothetical protein